MLDVTHEPLEIYQQDNNTYVLGSIGNHNIVIACLPAAQYGTNNAANVVTNLTRTFLYIRAGLMVGIGGGVPTKVDMRLGDIVVGTRVTQCDIGKVVGDGELKRTGTSRYPHQLLGTAVSSLRSKYELDGTLIPSILDELLVDHSEYLRPASEDLLFSPLYNHISLEQNCDRCDRLELVPRSIRTSKDPEIHYGAVASGNQVMRSATERDRLARDLDVLCFEMEAAGLMDVLPCLIIRGICDYSDSHKSKGWQRYAAVTAAAYARELLGVLPVVAVSSQVGHAPNARNLIWENSRPKPRMDSLAGVNIVCVTQGPTQENRQRLLESLRFDKLHFRKGNIETAHAKTCRWLLSHSMYKAWLDSDKLSQHHGFMWISGKPGAGKSTILKYIYTDMRKARNKHGLLAAFFFNARGELLEKSVEGMYRSILLELLEGYPDLQNVLDELADIRSNQNRCPLLNDLKDLLTNAVLALNHRPFTCFVDALDECDEQQVFEMTKYFEELSEQCMERNIPFRICFSSRHYPHIVINRALRFALEDQPGHAEDLVKYISSRLEIKDASITDEIISKAAGVFLWVVLVVDILNKEHRRGRPALKKRLKEIPSGLSELFNDMIRRDNENMEDMQLCILWILFANRTLSPKELYHAIWIGLALKNLVDPDLPDMTTPDAVERAEKFVVSASKGLAEVTKSTKSAVQFIHESVRDFLLQDKALQQIWPELGLDLKSLGHEKLKGCCNSYLMNFYLQKPEVHLWDSTSIPTEYPFLNYAGSFVLYHADATADGFPQDDFLSQFNLPSWLEVSNFFPRRGVHRYSPTASLFYILAERGHSKLIRTRLKEDKHIHIRGEKYEYPLFAALAHGNKSAAAALLGLVSIVHDGIDLAQGLKNSGDLKRFVKRTPISWAAQEGRTELVKVLLHTCGDINDTDIVGRTPLISAARNGHLAIVKLLLSKGAYTEVKDKAMQTPLISAAENGYTAILKLLLSKGAHTETKDDTGQTPILWACANEHREVVEILIKEGANIEARDQWGRTPFASAVEGGHWAIMELLTTKGANSEARDAAGDTPLMHAVRKDHLATVELLIAKGAIIEARNKQGTTPLSMAMHRKHIAIAAWLINKGADIEAQNNTGQPPFDIAVENGCNEAVMRLLTDPSAATDLVEGLSASALPSGNCQAD